jgi:hypothetical protein
MKNKTKFKKVLKNFLMSCFESLPFEIIDLICSFLSVRDIINFLFLTSKTLSKAVYGLKPTCYHISQVGERSYKLGNKIFFRSIFIDEDFMQLEKFLKTQKRCFENVIIACRSDKQKVIEKLQEKEISSLILCGINSYDNVLFLNNLKVKSIDILIDFDHKLTQIVFLFPFCEKLKYVILKCLSPCPTFKLQEFVFQNLNTDVLIFSQMFINNSISEQILNNEVNKIFFNNCYFSDPFIMPYNKELEAIIIDDFEDLRFNIPVRTVFIFSSVNMKSFTCRSTNLYTGLLFLKSSFVEKILVFQRWKVNIFSSESLSVKVMELGCYNSIEDTENIFDLKKVKACYLNIFQDRNIKRTFLMLEDCEIEILYIFLSNHNFCEIVFEGPSVVKNVFIFVSESVEVLISGDKQQRIEKITVSFQKRSNMKSVTFENINKADIEVLTDDSIDSQGIRETGTQEILFVKFISCKEIKNTKYNNSEVFEIYE